MTFVVVLTADLVVAGPPHLRVLAPMAGGLVAFAVLPQGQKEREELWRQ